MKRLPTISVKNGMIYTIKHRTSHHYFAEVTIDEPSPVPNGTLPLFPPDYEVGKIFINHPHPSKPDAPHTEALPSNEKFSKSGKGAYLPNKQRHKAVQLYNQWAKDDPDFQPIG